MTETPSNQGGQGQDEIVQPDEQSLKYAAELSQSLLDQQLSSTDTLLNRGTLVLGLAGVIISILLNVSIDYRKDFASYLLFFTIISIGFTIVLSLLSVTIKQYHYILTPVKLWEHSIKKESDFRKQIFANMSHSFEINAEILRKKSYFIELASIQLMVSLFAVLLLYIVVQVCR